MVYREPVWPGLLAWFGAWALVGLICLVICMVF